MSDYITFPGYNDLGFRSVTNIAALRRIVSNTPADGDNTIVDGGVSAGDGAGGMYVWSSTSLLADDGAGTIKPDDLGPSEAGRWLLVSLAGSASNHITLTEVAASSIPNAPAGRQTIFIDSADHKLKRKDFGGVITLIG